MSAAPERGATLRVSGRRLPDGEPFSVVARGERWEHDDGGRAELEVAGWVLPGLVDVHTHPGAHEVGDAFDEAVLRADLVAEVDAGVTALRAPGLAGDPPAWFGVDPELPRAFHAGPWLARPGQFFEGWGRRVADEEFAAVAAAQAATTGWCKIVGDWSLGDEPLPAEVLADVVAAVHAVGGRVAVHTQHAAGGDAAVRAGVDSIEHGMCLDAANLDAMQAQGTVLVPTLHVLGSAIATVAASADSARRTWFVEGAGAHPALVRDAFDAGVTVLAGTDSHDVSVLDEVRALVDAGMPVIDAIGSASWVARKFLGLGGLEPDGLADAVVFDEDPRVDLAVLANPRAVVLRGRAVRIR